MPSSAASNHEVKQQYINGHFCYAHKFGVLTNGIGIVRSIGFYNKDYLNSHPDIVVEKKAKSPDEDKSLADSKALLPTLRDFKYKHPEKNITDTKNFVKKMPLIQTVNDLRQSFPVIEFMIVPDKIVRFNSTIHIIVCTVL